MDPITMLRTVAALFTVAALGGLAMVFIRLARSVNPPSWLAMLHGFLAAAGVTLLLYLALTAGLPRMASWGLVLLLLAALGGAVLNLKYQWQRVLLPHGLMGGHIALAVIGYALVLLSVLR
jgi:hypothetical protein